MTTRHLEKIRVILKEATDLEISYAFDDLVFPDHSTFLIQFDDTDENNYFCYFREEMTDAEKTEISDRLKLVCEMHKCTLTLRGAFNMKQRGENVDIEFK